MRHVSATVELDAPPERVWAVLSDTAGQSTWNPFITSITGTLAVGERLTVRVAPPGGKPMRFRPTVTDVQPPNHLAWLGHLGIPGLFDGAHTFALTPLLNGRTQLVQSEQFSGALVWISRKLLVQTQAGFEAMHRALAAELSRRPPPKRSPELAPPEPMHRGLG
jgi:hypothetical protein